MKPKSPCLLALLLVSLAVAGPVYAQGSDGSCIVQVTQPTNPGQDAGDRFHRFRVEGTAELPSNQHLWVFTRHESARGSDEWWPQNEGKVSLKTGRWSVISYLGGPQDCGDLFDVAVAVFAPAENQLLHNYHARGSSTGQFTPIRMPAAVCPPILLEVRKACELDSGSSPAN